MAAPVRQTQERPGLFPRRPLKKAFQKFVATLLYTHLSKSKNSFCSGKANTKLHWISNLVLAGKQARVSAPKSGVDAPQTQWAALRAAHQMVGQKPKSLILEHLYDFARTYFIKNS